MAALTAEHQALLRKAVRQIEEPGWVARLTAYTGRPLDAALRRLPAFVHRRLRDAVQSAILKCLKLAVGTLGQPGSRHWAKRWSQLVAGLSGGLGGFFGLAALPVELPLTTTLMLRSIAEIARHEGEDLSRIESLLACLEVFALGASEGGSQRHEDYYTTRVVLSKLTQDMSRLMLERGAVNASSPVVARLVGEIAARFGLIVTDMAAATLVPVAGAVGGAAVNVMFMDHFQQVAEGHFAIRRLERLYGADLIKQLYHDYRNELRHAR